VVLAVAFINKSAESAIRLLENLKDEWVVASQVKEPPGKLYQTSAPRAREEQGGRCSGITRLPETKNGSATNDGGSVGAESEQRLFNGYRAIQRGDDWLRPFCSRSVSMNRTESGERSRARHRKSRDTKEEGRR
jgi:hypothetical protein